VWRFCGAADLSEWLEGNGIASLRGFCETLGMSIDNDSLSVPGPPSDCKLLVTFNSPHQVPF
jgi:hypothetical protein